MVLGGREANDDRKDRRSSRSSGNAVENARDGHGLIRLSLADDLHGRSTRTIDYSEKFCRYGIVLSAVFGPIELQKPLAA